MSLLDLMSEGNTFKNVHVNEIRPNTMNFYAHINDEDEEIYVSDMAEQLQEFGQDTNGVVYLDESVGDGKKYTLLAGERRWKATVKNYENGIGDGMFQVKVVPKPVDEVTEIIHIIMNNAQRNKPKEIRKSEVDMLNECWIELEAQGKKPKGKKREWIGKNTGLSARQVQEYLTGSLSDEGGSTATSDESNDGEAKKTTPEMTSADLDTLKTIEGNLKDSMGRKVKISKKCAITFYPNKDDMEDMFTILSDLGFTEEGFFK